MKNQAIRKLTTVAMLAAISIVLVSVVHFPLFPAAPFLEYDPADIPIFISAFLYGPGTGLVLTLVVSLVQGATVSAASGPIGILMHFFATGTFVLLSGWIYKKKHTRGGAMLSLTVGTLAMTGMMMLCNLVFTPLYGTPIEAVVQMLIPVILPFNLLKAAVNSIVTYVVYKPIARITRHDEALPNKA